MIDSMRLQKGCSGSIVGAAKLTYGESAARRSSYGGA
jgi:hypothetical protein